MVWGSPTAARRKPKVSGEKVGDQNKQEDRHSSVDRVWR